MSDIRILSGLFKGTKLSTLEGDITRPTTGRIVENIFNILTHNKFSDNFSFKKQKILDIFAGSGRLGLEALSRGAESAVFIDNNPHAGKIILNNIKKCHITDKAHYLNCDALKINLDNLEKFTPFSLVFSDAPYYQDLSNKLIKQLIDKKFLSNNAIICIETEKSYLLDIYPEMTLVDKRHYGITNIYFLKYNLLL